MLKTENEKVLFITNMYPHQKFQYMGVHIKEQIDCLKEDFGIIPCIYFINIQKGGKFAYLKSILEIFKIIKADETIKTIHIHYGLSALFLLFFRPKTRIFLTFHGGDILIKQGHYIQVMISKYIAKKVDKIFILNKEMEKIMLELRVPYELLPCGVDSKFFTNDAYDTCNNSSKLILFPGDSLRTVKNYPLFEQVVKILNNLNIFKIQVICVHNLTRLEVKELLNRADCLIMTSLSEGSPQIIKEALSCNLPVVSVPVGDVETVIDGIPSCFISHSFDPLELANLTVQALKSRKSGIRENFLKKGLYENKLICERLAENYRFTN